MASIELIDKSIGTVDSEPTKVKIEVEKTSTVSVPVNLIDESSTGSATYYEEIEITDSQTIYGFSINGSSTGGIINVTLWSTDDLSADKTNDNDWTDFSYIVMGSPSLSGAEVSAIYPVVTNLVTRKLRVKYDVTGGTTHTALVSALVI